MEETLQQIQKASLFTFLVSTMLATGLSLGAGSIVKTWRDVQAVLIALGLNFVLAPAVAWLLAKVIPLQQAHATGLLLLSGAAGAPFLPSVVRMARGDLAPAAGLMILLTLGTMLFMPLALPALVPGLNTPPLDIAGPLLLVIFAPLAAGMIVRPLLGSRAEFSARFLSRIGTASLLVLFALLIGLHIPALMDVLGSGAIAATVLFFIILFAAGWLLGGKRPEERGVLALGSSARNFGAAFVPATGGLRDPGVTLMLTMSAIVGLVMSFLAARWVRNRVTECRSAFTTHLHNNKL
jgi:BASS family bile acid:Na+ symporter